MRTAAGNLHPVAPPRVLVVEDEQDIAGLIKHTLERSGDASVEIVGRGDEALRSIAGRPPDLVILDLNLPVVSGDEVCRLLRQRAETRLLPIIMLTARTSESDRVGGLDLGADDYMTKPFSPRELVARVRAVFRRTDAASDRAEAIRAGDVTLDRPRMRAEVAGRRLDLTPTEFELLATLARQPGRIFTRAQLLDVIGGIEADSFERAIDAHVKNLRRKLEPDPRSPRYVLTVYGVGYRFAEP